MNILVINAGSSSLKYQLLNPNTKEVFAKGNCERIGIDGSFIGHEEMGSEKQKLVVDLPTHKEAIKHVFSIIKPLGKEVDGIGHRVVQGGWYISESSIVTDEVMKHVREVAPLAPLHNPVEADVIDICRTMFPSIPNVIVCDTSFHYHMPEKASRYALPRKVEDELHIRKYGMHGTSHRFIWQASSAFTHGETHKLVSCHLGSGASLCAIHEGKSVDTTMGLTPLDGLIMGTRTGTLDPAVVFYLVRVGGYTIDEIDTMMNKESGLKGLSCVSSDSRDIEQAAEKGDKNCIQTLEMYYYRTAALIAEMAQAMHGFDTIAFSAGVGENSDIMRAGIVDELGWLGVAIDPEKNSVRSDQVRDISAPTSRVRVLVVPTNEELMIALDVQALIA